MKDIQPAPARTPIKQKSEKRSKEDRLYTAKRVLFLTENPMCQAHIPDVCTQRSSQVHHKAGRTGELYLDITKWLSSCAECHSWIELHPIQAKELNLSENRL